MSESAGEVVAKADLPAIVGSFTTIKQRGKEYQALCIFHADSNPSMSLFHKGDKWRFQCWACGAHGDASDFLMEAEGIDRATSLKRLNGEGPVWTPKIATQPPKQTPDRVTVTPPGPAADKDFEHRDLGRPDRIIPFRDAAGALLGYECRWNASHERKKESRMLTYGARAPYGARWGWGHFSAPRPLCGLDRLSAMPEAQVLAFEGPIKAQAAQEVFPAQACIAWTGGARSWHRHDWEPLRGRRVILWPDNDAPGRDAVHSLAAVLADPKGLACELWWVDPNRMPESWDIRDAIAEGWDAGKLVAFVKERKVRFSNAPSGISEDQMALPCATPSPSPPDGAPEVSPESRHSDAESDPSRDSAEAEALASVQPRAKPHLSLVDGNTARAPDPDDDDEALPAGLSEDRIADVFAAQHKDDTRYCVESDCWYHWNGAYWEPDPTETRVWKAIRVHCRAVCHWQEALQVAPAKRDAINSHRTARAALNFVGRDHRIGLSRGEFDRDPWLLATPSQVWDLRLGKEIDPERDQLITRACSVDPVAGAHPLFDSVIARATGGSDTLTRYLWRWFGYLLTGDTREEAFLFLRGDEGSGKGTLVKAVAEIMGSYAWACSMDTLTEADNSRHPTSIAALDGPRFVYASETNVGRSWNEALVNWLTGRDKIVARKMRMDEYQYEARFKLLVYGNYRPHLKGGGMGLKRRIKIVEYRGKVSADEIDRTLKDRLRAEYPAILASMIRACLEWQDCGIGEPEEITDNVSAYIDAEDSFGGWLEERCARVDSARESIKDLYSDFKSWAKESSEFLPSAKRFAQLVEARGFTRCRPGGVRSFQGIRLLNHPASYS